jgi:hypothetical protein
MLAVRNGKLAGPTQGEVLPVAHAEQTTVNGFSSLALTDLLLA